MSPMLFDSQSYLRLEVRYWIVFAIRYMTWSRKSLVAQKYHVSDLVKKSCSPKVSCKRFGRKRTVTVEAPATDERKAGNAKSVARRTPKPPFETGSVAWFHTDSVRSKLRMS